MPQADLGSDVARRLGSTGNLGCLRANRRVDGIVRGVVDQQQVLVAKARNLRRTRDLLLPRLLSGQIDLTAAPGEVPEAGDSAVAP